VPFEASDFAKASRDTLAKDGLKDQIGDLFFIQQTSLCLHDQNLFLALALNLLKGFFERSRISFDRLRTSGEG
jgi:hypothetical protein